QWVAPGRQPDTSSRAFSWIHHGDRTKVLTSHDQMIERLAARRRGERAAVRQGQFLKSSKNMASRRLAHTGHSQELAHRFPRASHEFTTDTTDHPVLVNNLHQSVRPDQSVIEGFCRALPRECLSAEKLWSRN